MKYRLIHIAETIQYSGNIISTLHIVISQQTIMYQNNISSTLQFRIVIATTFLMYLCLPSITRLVPSTDAYASCIVWIDACITAGNVLSTGVLAGRREESAIARTCGGNT